MHGDMRVRCHREELFDILFYQLYNLMVLINRSHTYRNIFPGLFFQQKVKKMMIIYYHFTTFTNMADLATT